MTYDGRNPEPPYPTTEDFQAKHIEALEDQVLDLGIERSRLAARVAELERLLRMSIQGREPHGHGRPGFWDSFSPDSDFFRQQIDKGLCGPNGECFVCQARIQAQALNL